MTLRTILGADKHMFLGSWHNGNSLVKSHKNLKVVDVLALYLKIRGNRNYSACNAIPLSLRVRGIETTYCAF